MNKFALGAWVVVVASGCGFDSPEDPASSIRCGAGTREQAGECLPIESTATVLCGPGTTLREGACIPVSMLACGSGTHLVDGECVPDSVVACGSGTHLENGTCVPDLTVECGEGTHLVGGECLAESQLRCGTGTRMVGDECVGTGMTCGSGTVASGTSCAPAMSQICGTDTEIANSGTSCVGVLSCGSGTLRSGDVCRPNLSSVCGQGTTLSGSQCAIAASACGTGTTLINGRCEVPPPTTDLGAFSGNNALRVSYANFEDRGRNRTQHRVIITDLSQGSADGWTASLATPVGSGFAVHVRSEDDTCCSRQRLYVGEPRMVYIDSSVNPQGACIVRTPNSFPSTDLGSFVNFFRWTNTSATQVVCSSGGSIQLERFIDPQNADRVRITANVQFNDGTVWQDKIFVADYHEY